MSSRLKTEMLCSTLFSRNAEIAFLEVADELAGFVGDGDVQHHQVDAGLDAAATFLLLATIARRRRRHGIGGRRKRAVILRQRCRMSKNRRQQKKAGEGQ